MTPESQTKTPLRKTKQPTINRRQSLFVDEVVKGKTIADAARNAGYSLKCPGEVGGKLMKLPLVRAAVESRLNALKAANALSPQRILEELRRIALFDYSACFDSNGKMLPIHQLPPEARACIASVETRRINLESGDGQTDEVTRVRLVDKTKALDMLAKHLGLLTDKVEHSGTLVIRHELYTGQPVTPTLPRHTDVIDVSPIQSDSTDDKQKSESQ